MDGFRIFGQLMALLFVPVIVILDMALTTAWHSIIYGFLTPLGPIGSFLIIFLSLSVFIAGIVFAYFWVRTEAFHLLSVNA